MAKFHDRLAAIAESGEGYGDTFVDDITADYDEDMSGPLAAVAERDSAIEVLHGTLAERDAAIQVLKAQMFDMQQSAGVPVVEADDTEVIDDGESGGIDSLFTTENEDK